MLWSQAQKGIKSESEVWAHICRMQRLNRICQNGHSLYLMRSSHISDHSQKIRNSFHPELHCITFSQMSEPFKQVRDLTLKCCPRSLNLLTFQSTCLSRSLYTGKEDRPLSGCYQRMPAPALIRHHICVHFTRTQASAFRSKLSVCTSNLPQTPALQS